MKHFLVLVLFLSGCASAQKAETAVKQTVVDCSKEALKEAASQLVPAFLGILTADITNWKQQAVVLGKEFGTDVATCAARVALSKIVSPVQSEPNPQDPETIKRTATARVRTFEIETNL